MFPPKTGSWLFACDLLLLPAVPGATSARNSPLAIAVPGEPFSILCALHGMRRGATTPSTGLTDVEMARHHPPGAVSAGADREAGGSDPTPRLNLVSWSTRPQWGRPGAGRAGPEPEGKRGEGGAESKPAGTPPRSPCRLTWAQLLARVLKVGVPDGVAAVTCSRSQAGLRGALCLEFQVGRQKRPRMTG